MGTVEAVQALQVQSAQLQKSKEVYQAKCLELERLRKEGAPLKELEKVGHHALPHTSSLRSPVLSLHRSLFLLSSLPRPS